MINSALIVSILFIFSNISFASEIEIDSDTQYIYDIKTKHKTETTMSVELLTSLNTPTPFEVGAYKQLSDCYWTHKDGNGSVELTIKNNQNYGNSGSVLGLEYKEGIVKTLVSFTNYVIVGESKIIKLNDTCTIESKVTQNNSFNTILDLKLNEPTTVTLANGDEFIITVKQLVMEN